VKTAHVILNLYVYLYKCVAVFGFGGGLVHTMVINRVHFIEKNILQNIFFYVRQNDKRGSKRWQNVNFWWTIPVSIESKGFSQAILCWIQTCKVFTKKNYPPNTLYDWGSHITTIKFISNTTNFASRWKNYLKSAQNIKHVWYPLNGWNGITDQ